MEYNIQKMIFIGVFKHLLKNRKKTNMKNSLSGRDGEAKITTYNSWKVLHHLCMSLAHYHSGNWLRNAALNKTID